MWMTLQVLVHCTNVDWIIVSCSLLDNWWKRTYNLKRNRENWVNWKFTARWCLIHSPTIWATKLLKIGIWVHNLKDIEMIKCTLSIVFKLYLTIICKNDKFRFRIAFQSNCYFDEVLHDYIESNFTPFIQ